MIRFPIKYKFNVGTPFLNILNILNYNKDVPIVFD